MDSIKDYNELFFGRGTAKTIKTIKDGLNSIEEKYQEYFDNRKDENDKKDRLHNHYVIVTKPGSIQFNFWKDSDIEEFIKKDCIDFLNTVSFD